MFSFTAINDIVSYEWINYSGFILDIEQQVVLWLRSHDQTNTNGAFKYIREALVILICHVIN